MSATFENKSSLLDTINTVMWPRRNAEDAPMYDLAYRLSSGSVGRASNLIAGGPGFESRSGYSKFLRLWTMTFDGSSGL